MDTAASRYIGKFIWFIIQFISLDKLESFKVNAFLQRVAVFFDISFPHDLYFKITKICHSEVYFPFFSNKNFNQFSMHICKMHLISEQYTPDSLKPGAQSLDDWLKLGPFILLIQKLVSLMTLYKQCLPGLFLYVSPIILPIKLFSYSQSPNLTVK